MSFSPISNAPFPCGAPASTRTERTTSASAALRCSPATTWPGARLVARQSQGSRADHVAVSRADAALRRRRAGDARRGFTPLVHARSRSAPRSGLDRLYIKDESLNPTNSFKARGQSAAITRARSRREDHRAADRGQCRQRGGHAPRRPGLACEVFIPKGRQTSVHRRVPAVRRNVTLVDGLITDAGRMAAEQGRTARLVRRVDAEGAVSHRRQEDDGHELAEQMDWRWPDWIIYPTGGGTGMVGMWKAFDEIERIGWVGRGETAANGVGAGRELRAHRPRVSVRHPEGAAVGRRIDACRRPSRASRHRRLPDPARDLEGAAGRRSRCQISRWWRAMLAIGRHEGVSAAPEGALR